MNDSKKRLIFINRFFYPDISATSQVLTELVFELAKLNYEIIVITGSSSYLDSTDTFPGAEKINGVTVIRVAKSRFNRLNYFGRLVDISWFYFCAAIKLLSLVKKQDIVVCKTDPPLLIVIAALVKKIKRCKLVSWNQDLFPEVAKPFFKANPKKLIYPILLRIRNWAFRQSHASVAISLAMALKIKDYNVSNVEIITNWGKDLNAEKVKIDQLKTDWNIENKFIVAYSGNFGFAHEYETVRQVIDLSGNSTDLTFLFIGSGRYFVELEQHVIENKIENVIFKPYQPAEILAESLSVADIHLISLKSEMEGLVFPSKFYSICAVSRTILFIGEAEGELSILIKNHNCGRSFSTGQAKQICDYLNAIKSSPDSLKGMRLNARQLFEKDYTQNHAVAKWVSLLNRI